MAALFSQGSHWRWLGRFRQSIYCKGQRPPRIHKADLQQDRGLGGFVEEAKIGPFFRSAIYQARGVSYGFGHSRSKCRLSDIKNFGPNRLIHIDAARMIEVNRHIEVAGLSVVPRHDGAYVCALCGRSVFVELNDSRFQVAEITRHRWNDAASFRYFLYEPASASDFTAMSA